METIGGFTVTGRQFRGPASDLVELSAANGLRHTAIVFHPEYRSHSALDVSVISGFLESPLVTGLSELVHRDPKGGAFVYPTGECWSVAEVIRSLADAGSSDGHIRAGLELMHEAGQILSEAAERGEMDAVYSHGGLTPWRVMLKKDGQVEIIGHGLPQIEILQFTQNSSRVPREDSFRYCPPERIERQPENLASDLFSLALVAFELMTGRPVYDGLVVDIQQQAARGEGSRRLFRFRDKLPQRVRDLLTHALRPDMADRFTSGDEFLAEVRHVLSSSEATGGSLMEIMGRIASQGTLSGQALESGKTLMVEKDKLREMLDDGEDGEEPRRQAWSAPSRSRRQAPSAREDVPAAEPAAEPAAPAPAPAPAADESKWSRPSRDRRPASREPEPPPPQHSGGTGASTPADILARIRSSAADISPAHAAARERSRQTAQDTVSAILGGSGAGAAPIAPPPAPEPEPPAFTPGRSRRAPRRSSANNIAEMLTQSLANLQHRRPPSSEEVEEQQRALDDAERMQREAREQVEIEAARRRAEEETRRLAAEAEATRKKAAAEEAALRKAIEEEEAVQQRAAAEAAAQQKAAAEAAAQQKAAAEAATQQKAAAEATRKKAEEEATRKKVEEEATRRKAAEAAAAQEAAARKKTEEEARRKAAAEAKREQVAASAAMVEAARQQAEADEAARQQVAREASAAAQRAATEEGRRRAAEAAAEAQRRATLEVEEQRQVLLARVAELEAELTATRAVAAERAEKLYLELATTVREKVTASTKALVDAESSRWSAVRRAVLSAVEAAASQASDRIGASLGEGGTGEGLASEAAQAVAGALDFRGAETLERPPDVITVSSGKSGVATFNFQRGPGGRMVRIRLPLDATTAEAMAWLLGNVLPVRTDLAGRITGWYRLEDEGRRVPAAWKLEKLDPQKTYLLHFVQNEVRHADIEVRGGGAPARFVAPVGIAVPSVTLLDHLAAWLELPAGDWVLEMDGRPLAPYEILADVRLGTGLLRLKVGPRQ